MMPSRPTPEARGFSLLEVAIALAVLAVALTALAVPLAAQVHARRMDETRRLLGEAREAVLGYAAAHGRLPCPATGGSRGHEAFAHDGDASNGRCADFHGGFLPAAALGLGPLDDAGYLRDPWLAAANRVRYAVHAGTINGIAQALTRSGGMARATLNGLGAADNYLFVCASGAAAAGCGAAANQLTRRAAFVLLSLGPNAATAPPADSDEARNVDGDAAFVSREAVQGGFDDLVDWGSIHLVIARLVAAGRLP
jgi:prepilin-type N-terminal cleavage/methylation domain-containing protein